MDDFTVMHLPAEHLSDSETVTACEELAGPGEYTENVNDATCLDCLRASILPALAQGRREGAEEERDAVTAYLSVLAMANVGTTFGEHCARLAAAIKDGKHRRTEAPRG